MITERGGQRTGGKEGGRERGSKETKMKKAKPGVCVVLSVC